MKILWPTVRICLHALNETDNALLHDFGRKAECVCLERIGSCCIFGVDRGPSLVLVKRIRENRRDEFFRVAVLQMNQVSGAVEREAVLRKRDRKSTRLNS